MLKKIICLLFILILPLIINADFKQKKFMQALISGDVKQIEKLINKVDIYEENENGNTPFNYFIQYFDGIPNNSEIFNLLVKAGADINSKDRDGNTPLINAIYYGYNELAMKLIKTGADIKLKDKNGKSPLYHSIEKNNKDVFDLLIEKGADFNETDQNGQSLLFKALSSLYIFNKLIELGVDINRKDKQGSTVLHWAVYQNNDAFINLLLKNGADPNIINENRDFPLKTALAYGNYKIIELLIKHGADVNIKHDIYKNVLMYFVKNINNIKFYNKNLSLDEIEKIVKLFIKNGANIDEKDTWNGDTALMYSVMDLDYELTKMLIKSGAKVNVKNKHGETALHKLFYTGLSWGGGYNNREESKEKYLKILNYLIKSGANVNIKDKNDVIPLFYALDLKDAVKILLKTGSGVNVYDNYSKSTPIFFAGSYPEVVDLLIKNGAKINLKNNEGTTPLMNACSSYNGVESVKILIKNGAKLNERNNNGDTVLTFAAKRDDVETIKYLLQKGVKSTERDLKTAIDNYNFNVFNYLVENVKYSKTDLGLILLSLIPINKIDLIEKVLNKGTDLNMIVEFSSDIIAPGSSILTIAVRYEFKNAVKLFVDYGADIEARDFFVITGQEGNTFTYNQTLMGEPTGKTVMDWAAEIGNEEIIKILKNGNIWNYVKNGNTEKVKEFCKNKKQYVNIEKYYTNQTLLFPAIENNHDEIVKILIDSGIDVNKKSLFEESPLPLAASKDQNDIVKLLLNAGADINIFDGSGNTAYSYAVKNKNIEMQQLLLKYGAKKTKYNKAQGQ